MGCFQRGDRCFVLLALGILVLVALYGEFQSLSPDEILSFQDGSKTNSTKTTTTTTTTIFTSSIDRTISFSSDNSNSIPPGGLPGYTGWGRPEKTLARYFRIREVYETFMEEEDGWNAFLDYFVVLECKGHKDCVSKDYHSSEGPSLFYLRAYGPAVLPGIVTSTTCTNKACTYRLRYRIMDPGTYTIEAVLTFSNPPPVAFFPLPKEEEPNYEGYLVPGFPLLKTFTVDGFEAASPNNKKVPCTLQDFADHQSARWKVTGITNDPNYTSPTMNSPLVSTMGYNENVNSLGYQMEYFKNGCLILPVTEALSQCSSQRRIRFVYIGDSVLRVQKDHLQRLLIRDQQHQHGPNHHEFDFYSLHGGYLKNQELGPTNLSTILEDLSQRAKTGQRIALLFNTGLHDIHRLCGSEWEAERPSYVPLDFKSCLDEYERILLQVKDQLQSLQSSNVLVVVQSTTAAWPKYGNWGIAWPQSPQPMPLDAAFAAAFNRVLYERLSSVVSILDGYWITYARPDDREYGDIGKRLSHPGKQVLEAMTRIWAMTVAEGLCPAQQ